MPASDLRRAPEQFSARERAVLERYFTNVDRPVFALIDLPEVVKGALFARYSRSQKSLRRLFLDEFHPDLEAAGDREAAPGHEGPGVERAERLYERVFNDYGDDSVAQLGGAHLACEGASNVLTKVLERGRLMAYLEQSTRYIPYTARPGGRWKYVVPPELDGPDHSALRERYCAVLDDAFATYARWIEPAQDYYADRFPRTNGDSEGVHRAAIRAKALDTLRGLLPAATQSNVGLYGSGQAYEALLLRMQAHPLAEVREYGAMMLEELRNVIPAFLTRVDRPDRGGRWVEYLENTRRQTEALAERLTAGTAPEAVDEVTLVDYDPDGEEKVLAAALYPATDLPDAQLRRIAARMTPDERAEALRIYAGGQRANRRHKPGRAFERTAYRFDILGDYGAFRDLQRHRMLTIEWQRLTPAHGAETPFAIDDLGARDDWDRILAASRELHDALAAAGLAEVASYAVSLAYRVRFSMQMNAREAMHIIELRSAPQGHPSYRHIAQQMHRLIERVHPAIAATMDFADHSEVELERLEAERRLEKRREARGG